MPGGSDDRSGAAENLEQRAGRGQGRDGRRIRKMDGIAGHLTEVGRSDGKKVKKRLQYKELSTIISLSYLRINFAMGKYDKPVMFN